MRIFGDHVIVILLVIYFTRKVTLTLVPLHQHDDYGKCLQHYKDQAVYCSAKIYIRPDEGQLAWQEIVQHSSDFKHHFRHDLLDRSYCMNDCIIELSNLNRSDELVIPKFEIDPKIYHPGPDLKIGNLTDHQIKYGESINKCANLQLRSYGLKGYSEIKYCLVQKEISKDLNFDWIDISVISLLVGLCLLTLAATYYDFQLQASKVGKKSMKQILPSELLLTFSLPRNWENFIAVAYNYKNDDFAYFEGIRVILEILNTIAHVFVQICASQLANPSAIEKLSQTVLYKVIGTVFSNQVFFCISGFLLTLRMAQEISDGKVLTLFDCFQKIRKRFLRMIPLTMFVMLLEMTLIRRISFGPVFTEMASKEWVYCRKNWWTNILFISTWVKEEEKCLQFSKFTKLKLFHLDIFFVIYKFVLFCLQLGTHQLICKIT